MNNQIALCIKIFVVLKFYAKKKNLTYKIFARKIFLSYQIFLDLSFTATVTPRTSSTTAATCTSQIMVISVAAPFGNSAGTAAIGTSAGAATLRARIIASVD